MSSLPFVAVQAPAPCRAARNIQAQRSPSRVARASLFRRAPPPPPPFWQQPQTWAVVALAVGIALGVRYFYRRSKKENAPKMSMAEMYFRLEKSALAGTTTSSGTAKQEAASQPPTPVAMPPATAPTTAEKKEEKMPPKPAASTTPPSPAATTPPPAATTPPPATKTAPPVATTPPPAATMPPPAATTPPPAPTTTPPAATTPPPAAKTPPPAATTPPPAATTPPPAATTPPPAAKTPPPAAKTPPPAATTPPAATPSAATPSAASSSPPKAEKAKTEEKAEAKEAKKGFGWLLNRNKVAEAPKLAELLQESEDESRPVKFLRAVASELCLDTPGVFDGTEGLTVVPDSVPAKSILLHAAVKAEAEKLQPKEAAEGTVNVAKSMIRELVEKAAAIKESKGKREVLDKVILVATNSQSMTNTITPDVEAGTPVYEGSLRYKTLEALFDVYLDNAVDDIQDSSAAMFGSLMQGQDPSDKTVAEMTARAEDAEKAQNTLASVFKISEGKAQKLLEKKMKAATDQVQKDLMSGLLSGNN